MLCIVLHETLPLGVYPVALTSRSFIKQLLMDSKKTNKQKNTFLTINFFSVEGNEGNVYSELM